MRKRRSAIRVYADTSVYGGVFDARFKRPTESFFECVRQGKLTLVASALVGQELIPAPARVRNFYREVSRHAERIRVAEAALQLRDSYVEAGIVGRRSAADAPHVALATVHACRVLVSWNCKHIVHFKKIPKYNALNRLHGHGEIAIHTPLEVIDEDDDDGEEEVV